MQKYFLFFVFIFLNTFSQESYVISWSDAKTVSFGDSLVSLLDFDNSIYNPLISLNSLYFKKIAINSDQVTLDVMDVVYTELLDSESDNINKEELTSYLQYEHYVSTEKKQNFLFFYLVPFIKKDNSIYKVTSFKLSINEHPNSQFSHRKQSSSNSVLSTGNWYKIGVTQTGLHIIDANFLNSMGVDLPSVNPNSIKIYGNKAGMLKEGVVEIDDLLELAIDVIVSRMIDK